MDPLLQELSTARGIAGQESAVRAILRQTVQAHVDELSVDSIGNLIVRKAASPPSEQPTRVMIAAHMDEVGGIVTAVSDDGTLRFRNIGGLDPRILPGKRVQIGAEPVAGVVMRAPQSRNNSVVPIADLRIDTGGASGIQPGDMITFESDYGPVGRLLQGKAFDDRVGCYILARLLEDQYPCELVGVFTVQEEIGLRGARVAAYTVAPDVAFALEGTIADDLPKDEDLSPTTELGKGPAISIMDRSAFADRRLLRLLTETATTHQIPFQIKQPGVGGTDLGAIHLAREGVPSIALAVPCRYIHTPTAFMDPTDVEHTINLMKHALATGVLLGGHED